VAIDRTLPVPEEGRRVTFDVFIDPRGRWIASRHNSRIIVWRLPLDPLFRELPYDALMAELRSRTNVRVVPDPNSTTEFIVTNTTELQSE